MKNPFYFLLNPLFIDIFNVLTSRRQINVI